MTTPPTNSGRELREGLDYYVEAGRWVFTAEYHMARGHCCENICRHCPFGNSPTDRAQAVGDIPPRTSHEAE